MTTLFSVVSITDWRYHAKGLAFTLVELLLAMTILSLLLVILSSILNMVSTAWIRGEQQVELFQGGRAILDLMSRDLASAVIAPRLQFIQSPDNESNRYSTSSSLYWQTPISSGAGSNLCEVGYYLDQAIDKDHPNGKFELKRLCVKPDNAAFYHIYTAGTGVSSNSPTWLTDIFGNPSAYAGSTAVYSTVSGGVLGVWIRCLDSNGEPVPWFKSTVKYNSAANFQPSVRGQYQNAYSSSGSSPGQFPYMAASTMVANRLPSAVEITIVTLDQKAMARNPHIPDYPQPSDGPIGIPKAVRDFNVALVSQKITSAQTFTTVVKLANGSQ